MNRARLSRWEGNEAIAGTSNRVRRGASSVGLSRSELIEGRPLPATRALIDWFELSTKQRSFFEAAATINLAAEGQVPGADVGDHIVVRHATDAPTQAAPPKER